jgi:hypothetical protein
MRKIILFIFISKNSWAGGIAQWYNTCLARECGAGKAPMNVVGKKNTQQSDWPFNSELSISNDPLPLPTW